MSGSKATSTLRIIALIAVIAAALYFIYEQAQDDEIEIDIGLVVSAQQVAAGATVRPALPVRIGGGRYWLSARS